MSTFSNCPTCGQTKRECDDSAAHGHDNCCMTCDELGRLVNHRVLTVKEVTDEHR